MSISTRNEIQARMFGAKLPYTPWNTLSKIPKEYKQYVIDEPVWTDVKKDDIERHGKDERLDSFQRTLVCLSGDMHQKTFAAQEVVNLSKLNIARTFQEILPPLVAEAKVTKDATFHLEFATSLASICRNCIAAKQDDYVKQLLGIVGQYLDSPDKEIVSVWLQTVEGIMDLLQPGDAIKLAMPIIEEKARRSTTPLEKNVACILIRKVGTMLRFRSKAGLSHDDVKSIWKNIIEVTKKLAADESKLVKSGITLVIPELLSSKASEPSSQELVNVILSLASSKVEADVATSLVIALCRASMILRNSELLPKLLSKLKHFVKQGVKDKNVPLLIHFSKWLVPTASSVKPKVSMQDQLWFIDAYFYLSQFGPTEFPFRVTSPPALVELMRKTKISAEVRDLFLSTAMSPTRKESDKHIDKQVTTPWHAAGSIWATHNDLTVAPWMVRQECAANIVGMYKFLKGLLDFRTGLHTAVVNFSHDPHPYVRKNMALRLASLLNIEANTEVASQLQDDIISALSDDTIDVVEALGPSLASILKHLAQRKIISPNVETKAAINILGAIMFCEQRLGNTIDWRAHSTFLIQLGVLPHCVQSDMIYNSVIPVLIKRMKTTPHLPTRLGAAQSLVACLRYCRREKQRESIRSEIKSLAKSSNAHDRMLYLYVSNIIMDRFSRKYFREHFFDTTLNLAEDDISNVRAKTANLLPKLSIRSEDEKMLKRLKDVTKHLQMSEDDRDALEAIRSAVKEMAKLGVTVGNMAVPYNNFTVSRNSDSDDRRKQQEEESIAALEKQPEQDPSAAKANASTGKNVAKGKPLIPTTSKPKEVVPPNYNLYDNQQEATLIYPTRRLTLLNDELSPKTNNVGLPNPMALGGSRQSPRTRGNSVDSETSSAAQSSKGPPN